MMSLLRRDAQCILTPNDAVVTNKKNDEVRSENLEAQLSHCLILAAATEKMIIFVAE